MPNCTTPQLTFPSFDRRKIEANFAGGDVSSDGGILLLREADRRLGLVAALDAARPDPRNPDWITHRQADLLRQRIYGLALGYEDLNDHGTLRGDLAWQTALERDTELASSPTLCRLEQRVDRKAAVAFHAVLIEKFIASFAEAPTELILDFDATEDRVHGNQEGRFYHGYYGDWCFLPLYVFCGEQLLVSYLRPSDEDGERHAWAILKLLTKRLRAAWPEVRLIVRADSGFCRGEMENRIKEQQLGLFSDRTSCHSWWANQFRVILSAAAYVLMETIRRVGLRGTELARAQVGTMRLKLLKIGTVIVRNTRRIRLFLSSAYPHQELFASVCRALSSA